MADVLLVTELCLPVLLQQPLLLRHAQLSLRALVECDFDEPPVSSWPKRLYFPYMPILTAHDAALLEGKKPLCERVINEDPDYLVPVLELLRLAGFLDLNKFPDVVLWDMVGGVGTARDFVEEFAVGVLDFVRVEVVFGFEVAEYD